MIEADCLTMKRASSGSNSWDVCEGDAVVGELVFTPPITALPPDLIGAARPGRCIVGLLETVRPVAVGPITPLKLWVAGVFFQSAHETLDSVGKNFGGWQGEWMRVLGHPAGRVLTKTMKNWEWISPKGKVLAIWGKIQRDAWRVEFVGLQTDQGFCRMMALLKAGEILTQDV
jgi:hypothetical protein